MMIVFVGRLASLVLPDVALIEDGRREKQQIKCLFRSNTYRAFTVCEIL